MHRVRTLIGGTVLAVAVFVAGPAYADPAGPADPPGPVDQAEAAVDQPIAGGPGPGDPVADACKQFTAALDVAATNYEDFAYASAGSGDFVNYQDPTVDRANQVGRMGLRAAAGAALEASRTPGLPPEVADPMQSWSLHATKLIFIMGLRGGGDSLNAAATALNTDANNAQTACAVTMRRG